MNNLNFIAQFIIVVLVTPGVILSHVCLAESDYWTRNALHEAAANGDMKKVKRLLAMGFKIDTFDDIDNMPIHRAASGGRTEIVKLQNYYWSMELMLTQKMKRG